MFTHIYIHIPFCRRKCPYCSFFSVETTGDDIERYVILLQDEMLIRSKTATPDSPVTSIYFGGGTPSLLKPQQVADILESASVFFPLAPNAEITLEANPGTVDREILTGYRQAGVNRLSIGIQSFDDTMLAELGRIHSSRDAVTAVEAARQAGFDNIGIDLINSLPGQTAAMWRKELEQAVRLNPEHLSVYGLSIEQDTPFAARFPEDHPRLPDQDLAADMFEAADDFLESSGYEHYEIANYARPGRHSNHNCGYWKRDGYLGLGAGAHSFLRETPFGTRSSNAHNIEEYSRTVREGLPASADTFTLTREDAMAEFLFLGLRMAEGISYSGFRDQFGIDVKAAYRQQVEKLVLQNLLQESQSHLRLTRRGRLLSNQVFQQFLP